MMGYVYELFSLRRQKDLSNSAIPYNSAMAINLLPLSKGQMSREKKEIVTLNERVSCPIKENKNSAYHSLFK